jgi:hypothetical protein
MSISEINKLLLINKRKRIAKKTKKLIKSKAVLTIGKIIKNIYNPLQQNVRKVNKKVVQ